MVPPGVFLSPPLSLLHTLIETHMQCPCLSTRNEEPPLHPHNRSALSLVFISSQSFIWEMESEQLPPITCCSSGEYKREEERRAEMKSRAGGSCKEANEGTAWEGGEIWGVKERG